MTRLAPPSIDAPGRASRRSEPPRRTRARRGDGARLRGEILAATDRLLRDRGSESNVSIEAIARAVGCTAPAIYLHFADKRTLIRAVCEAHFGTFADTLNAAAAEHDEPLAALAARGRAYTQFGLENPESYRILFMLGPENEPATAAPDARPSAAFDDQVNAVQQCIDAGHFPPGSAHRIACSLWAASHGVTSLMISRPEFPWPPLDEFVDSTCIALGLGLTQLP